MSVETLEGLTREAVAVYVEHQADCEWTAQGLSCFECARTERVALDAAEQWVKADMTAFLEMVR